MWVHWKVGGGGGSEDGGGNFQEERLLPAKRGSKPSQEGSLRYPPEKSVQVVREQDVKMLAVEGKKGRKGKRIKKDSWGQCDRRKERQ